MWDPEPATYRLPRNPVVWWGYGMIWAIATGSLGPLVSPIFFAVAVIGAAYFAWRAGRVRCPRCDEPVLRRYLGYWVFWTKDHCDFCGARIIYEESEGRE